MTEQERLAAAAVMASKGPWQYRVRQTLGWTDLFCEPDWDWFHIEYRVKPASTIRPWRIEEVPVGMTLLNKTTGRRALIVDVSNGFVYVGYSAFAWNTDKLLAEWTLYSGGACGVKEG
jgi:hypothetical protein